jgi:trigger factor
MYTNIAIKKLDGSRVEITGSIEAKEFESFRKAALKNINESVNIDGFRKGKIPEKTLIAKVGEMPILEEMAELALSKAYPDIVVEHKVDAIGRPEIQITKIAANNPLEFKITTAVIPEVKLADYKKIAKDVNAETTKDSDKKSTVTEKDVDEAITRIRKSHAEHNHVHDESHDKLSKEDHDKMVEAAMPALDDAFVTTLGDFKDVADFKDKVQTMLADDKKSQLREKHRIELADKISDATEVIIPEVLINSEVKRIEAQFREDVTRMGVTFEDYLKHAKKTLEEVHKEWRPHAEKKAKLQIVLNKISEAEKLAPTAAEIEEEVKHITDHYKDADKERAYVYAETVLMNEKVFQFLEAIK